MDYCRVFVNVLILLLNFPLVMLIFTLFNSSNGHTKFGTRTFGDYRGGPEGRKIIQHLDDVCLYGENQKPYWTSEPTLFHMVKKLF